MPLGEVIGTGLGILSNLFGAKQARDDSMDLAKHSVEYRVADAKKAGIHPLAALGMAPIASGGVTVGDPGFAQMGAALDNSFSRAATGEQRGADLSRRLLETQISGVELDNQLKQTELASKVKTMYGAGSPPPMPSQEPASQGPVSYMLPDGNTWTTGKSADSQTVENSYGDIAQEGYGLWRLFADTLHNYNNSHEVKQRAFEAHEARVKIKNFIRGLFGQPAY